MTNTLNGDSAGIVIDSQNVAVRGNQVLSLDGTLSDRRGIDTVDFPETILIERNQVIGWVRGIRARGAVTLTKRAA